MNSDKTLWENEWLAVKQKDGWYTYSHAVKCNGNGVAVLGYTDDGMVLGRFENVPCHNEGLSLVSLTGMVDLNEEPLQTAMRELYEEAGLETEEFEFVSLGTVHPSKSSDTTIHCFAISLNYQDGKLYGKGDGTKGEEGSYCQFVTFEEAVWSKDPLITLMMGRLTDILSMEKLNEKE